MLGFHHVLKKTMRHVYTGEAQQRKVQITTQGITHHQTHDYYIPNERNEHGRQSFAGQTCEWVCFSFQPSYQARKPFRGEEQRNPEKCQKSERIKCSQKKAAPVDALPIPQTAAKLPCKQKKQCRKPRQPLQTGSFVNQLTVLPTAQA